MTNRTDTPAEPTDADAPLQLNARFYFGTALLGLSLLMPLLSLVVLQLEMSTELRTLLIGALSVGGPEVALIAAAAVLGKRTLDVLKTRLFRWLARLLPSVPASKARYNTCLALMLLVQLGWYAQGWAADRLPAAIAGPPILIASDLIFWAAFLAAGPEFYEKVAQLFRWEGQIPARP